jgi:MFS family permease
MPKGYWTTWLTTFVFFGAFYAVLVPLPLYLAHAGLPDWQIGLILGAFGVGSLISRPFAGIAADRWGARPVLLFGAAAATSGVIGMSLTTHPVLLLGLRATQTVGYVAFTTSATALIASLVPAERRASFLALFGVAANVAMTITPAIMNLLLTRITLRQGFWISGALAALCGGLVWLVAPHKSTSGKKENAVEGRELIPQPLSLKKRRGLLSQLLPRSCSPSLSERGGRGVSLEALSQLIGMAVVLGIGFGAFLQFTPLLAARRSVGPVGLAYTVYGLGIIGTRVLTGRLLDRQHRVRLLAGAFLIMLVGAGGLAWAPSQFPFLGASVCIAVASGILHPGLMALHVEQFSAAERGRAASLFYLGFDLGIGLGAWCAAPVLQRIGLTGLYALAACAQIVGLIVLYNFSKRSGFGSP